MTQGKESLGAVPNARKAKRREDKATHGRERRPPIAATGECSKDRKESKTKELKREKGKASFRRRRQNLGECLHKNCSQVFRSKRHEISRSIETEEIR